MPKLEIMMALSAIGRVKLIRQSNNGGITGAISALQMVDLGRIGMT